MVKKLSVIVYSMNDCPFCARAKAILKEMNVEFEERNVSANMKYRQELITRTKEDRLPTIIVNKEILVKPGEDKLRATINFERHR